MKKAILLFVMSITFSLLASASTTQGNYRWRNDDGDLTSSGATWREGLNQNTSIDKNANVRIRFELYYSGGESDGPDETDIGLFYTVKDDENWVEITKDGNNAFVISPSTYYDDTDITDDPANSLLTNTVVDPPNTFGGGYAIDDAITQNFTTYDGYYYESEYCFKTTENAQEGVTYEMRLAAGEGYWSYDRNPELTITADIPLSNVAIYLVVLLIIGFYGFKLFVSRFSLTK